MRKKNLIIIILIIVGTLEMIAVEGYIKPEISRRQKKYVLEQLDPLTNDYKNIIKFKNKYMGNASNIINLNWSLPLSDIPMTFELFPDKLTMEINYKKISKDIGNAKLERALIYNSAANFMLIDNLKAIKYNFKDKSFTITRDAVESWLGIKPEALQDEKLWNEKVQSRLKDERYVNKIFSQNTK